jgi:hypothetical protein
VATDVGKIEEAPIEYCFSFIIYPRKRIARSAIRLRPQTGAGEIKLSN